MTTKTAAKGTAGQWVVNAVLMTFIRSLGLLPYHWRNALVAAATMTGYEGHRVIELPHDRLQEVLKKYNRLELPKP